MGQVWLRKNVVERVCELRKRAADYERAAADPSLPTSVRTRYVLIANHYRVVANGEERAERARWRVQRQLVGQLVNTGAL
jgi:hypothetical protein